MANGKRYFWIKFQSDFFEDKRMKKLRKIAGGDTYITIYLKMLLLSLKNEGCIEYSGLEETFVDELALELDETAENVGVTVRFLLAHNLLVPISETSYILPYAVNNTGSEGSSAARMRKLRGAKVSHCDSRVTQMCKIGDGEKEIDKEIEIDPLSPSEPCQSLKALQERFRSSVSVSEKAANICEESKEDDTEALRAAALKSLGKN